MADPFEDFLKSDPAINSTIAYIGPWSPGCADICLDGDFTLAALRALVAYMEQHTKEAE